MMDSTVNELGSDLQFIQNQPPFGRLSETELKRVIDTLETVHFAQGAHILRQGGQPSRHLYLIRSGVVKRMRDGQVIQLLEEGDFFGYPSLLNQISSSSDVIVEEDVVAYLIPEVVFHELVDNADFAEFFLKNLSERLKASSDATTSTLSGDLTTSVEALIVRPPVTVSPLATVAEVAQIMTKAWVDSVIVLGDPPGIVTDHDFRVRVLAEGLGPDTLVNQIMSRPLLTQSAETPVYATMLFMLEENIRHLALTQDGEIIGVIAATDLLRHQAKSPLYLLRQLETLESSSSVLPRYGFEIAGTVETLFTGGLDVAQIGHIIASLNDALVRKLLKLAEDELGPPPTPYAWIVFGSEGRMEQALLTDQDNGLVYLAEKNGAQAYFKALVERVVNSLVQAGFPPCAGGYMATNWCHPLDHWLQLFKDWVMTPEPQAVLESAIFFDFRSIYGGLSLEPLEKIILGAGNQKIFLGHLANTALKFQPPLGFFRRIRDEDGLVDLKRGGIAPIVALARVYGLAAQTRDRSTLERLEAAAAAHTLSREGTETLAETYGFLLRLRLREQLTAIKAAHTPDNNIRLEALSPLENRHLKEAFLAIREMQAAMAQHFQTGLLG
jgi:CBS domain-containing protein